MERYSDDGERFNDHQLLNSTPWFPENHRLNFPADHHHHHYNHQPSRHQPSQQHRFERFPNHQQWSSEQNDVFWSNGSYSGRKRGFQHSSRGASPENTDGSNLAKFYVATIPRTANEENASHYDFLCYVLFAVCPISAFLKP